MWGGCAAAWLTSSRDGAGGGLVGVFNFTNPGVISHNQVLDLYTKYIDPNFKYTNFTLEEQALVIKAPRSNNELDCSKLLALYPALPPILDSMDAVFQRMKINLDAESKEKKD